MDKIQVVKLSVDNLLQGNISGTRAIIEAEYPFQKMVTQQRRYTDKEKINQFKRDGFIDRYTGQKLVNPGVLKVMSYYMPDIFPCCVLGTSTDGRSYLSYCIRWKR